MQMYQLGARQAVQAMRAGQFSPTEYVGGILERIEATESRLQAWETLDAEGALAQARVLEAMPVQQRGRLYGLTLGVKDVIHVKGLPTSANFEPYRGKPVERDAAIVAYLREAGAIILGKTVTTQFAWGQDRPKTRNPWNLEHTPGGSSSGTAAMVGAWQVPAAIGTQTTGSLLRPSAYCGAVAIKPTFGRLSCYGVLPTAWSSDHPGIVVRSVADAALILQAISRYDPRDPYSLEQEPEDFVSAARDPGQPPRLGVVREMVERSNPSVRAAAEQALERLAAAGAELRDVELPLPFETLLAIHTLVHSSEGAAIHAEQFSKYPDQYLPGTRVSAEVYQLLPAAVAVHASRWRRRTRTPMAAMLDGLDALVAPTAPDLPPRIDPAPAQRPLGDTTFQAIWTSYGFPNITIPTFVGTEGLPHAIEIVGRPRGESAVLRAAAWCETLFERLPAPL